RMKLKDKTAIVTGGAQGIGRGIAIRFAEEGANVVVADLNVEGAETVAFEIKENGGQALSIGADVGESGEVDRLIKSTLDKFQRVDILVNNAAYIKKLPFLEITEEDWDKIIKVSLKGYFLCSQAAARVMSENSGGRIINIASMVGAIAHAGLSAYAVAKAGVIAMTKQIGTELHKHNINVNAIAPGPISTALMNKVMGSLGRSDVPKSAVKEPDDVAEVAVYLGSDDSRQIYGNVLSVGGGGLMG
ncbi:MAG: SDR family NAD(P)-dependent oxidoreductase, partial [Thermodesulfobacteriota bacterium]